MDLYIKVFVLVKKSVVLLLKIQNRIAQSNFFTHLFTTQMFRY